MVIIMSNSSKHDLVGQIKLFLVIPAALMLVTTICGILFAADGTAKIIFGILALVTLCSIVTALVVISKRVDDKIYWFTKLLDSIPFPISVTDKDMNWTFINKPVEDMLKTTRAACIGKHCSNWGAGICKTQKCGITCLKRGTCETTFEQGGMSFKVDAAYIHDRDNNVIGHIEVVQDISKLNSMKQLEVLLKRIEEISPILASSANQTAASSHALAQGATEQAASVVELSNSVNDIRSKINDNATNAKKASQMALEATSAIQSSNIQMQKLVSSMNTMESQSHEIRKIIKTIEDIAFQTNILALNAAVEAARAGVAGKGFAVVADEVRNLAAKSADAAKNTTTLIEDSVASIVEGVRLAGITATELNKAVDNVTTTTNVIAEITKVSGEQAQAVSQVSMGIDQISSVVQTNSATSEETAAASQELSAQVKKLNSLTKSL